MTHEIIQTENYLLIVDDSEIKIGDIVLEKYVDGTIGLEQIDTLNNIHSLSHKKIIAHLPLNGASILNGVDLLPPLEDEVEKLTCEYFTDTNPTESAYQNGLHIGFKAGYNKAKEKYKYTEEEIRKCWTLATKYAFNRSSINYKSFIQSLQQPKMPVGFNLEAKDTYIKNGVLVKTQWVGKYIY
jgi:hypothetical protein